MGHKGDGMQLEGQLVVFMLLQHWFSEWPEFPLHRGARSPVLQQHENIIKIVIYVCK
jgi:hypothetical protein